MGRLGGGGPKHPVTRGKEPGQNLLSWGQSRPSQAVCDRVYPSRLLTKRNVGRSRGARDMIDIFNYLIIGDELIRYHWITHQLQRS